MEVGMSKDQYNRLYKALRTSIDGRATFTLKVFGNEGDSLISTIFQSHTRVWTRRSRCLIAHYGNWAVDLILDPQLAPHFEWDAQKVFKHDGENVTRVYDEPWTADTFWNFQSQIPEGARPLCFILYADKAKLSSFGTEMAYPVVARCANLPTEIRNGHGVGGGRVVGWLPNVPETPEDSKKPAFINFKRETWPLRTAAHVKQILREVRALSKSDHESHLSKHGIRDVNNVFWLVNNSDPHHALFFDRLHSNNAGLFGHHLWQRFKDLVSRNRDAAAKRPTPLHSLRFGRAPRWRGLTTSPEVMKVSFTDGAKFEDISKVVVFAAQNIIQRSEDKKGGSYYSAYEAFPVLGLLLSFEVHTEKTIMLGGMNWRGPTLNYLWHRRKLRLQGQRLELPQDARVGPQLRRYRSERCFTQLQHEAERETSRPPIRKLYNRTNFKNVASQILNRKHLGFVAALIRNQIDELDLDAAAREQATNDTDLEPDPDELGSTQAQHIGETRRLYAGVVILRSQQRPVTLEAVGDLTAQNPTFKNFLFSHQALCALNSKADDQVDESFPMAAERHDFLKSVNTHFAWYDPLDIIPTGQSRVSDRDLRLRRLRARQSTEFFFAQSIVRGAPLIQDFAKLGDYFVMDVVDHTGDLFLRCDEIFGW
ncbi:hypothetical protein BJY52DRAFT_1194069 [Lactarius psammicola]|nr:hypothetical protein BJY52DRAFT_1194069 [Lactarius psammicola]